MSEAEVREALQEGSVNWRKSRRDAKPCPTFAFEDRTDDGQRVRIIYAACDRDTRVVTAIDLENDHPCECP